MPDTFVHARGVPGLLFVMPTYPSGSKGTSHNFHGLDGDAGKWIQSVTPGDMGTSHTHSSYSGDRSGILGGRWQ